MKRTVVYFRRSIPILLVIVLIILSACTSTATTAPTTTTASTTTATQTTASSASSVSAAAVPPTNVSSLSSVPISAIVNPDSMFVYFVSNGNLTIYATALLESNLLPELQGKGPYTAFVPTNEAFGKIPLVSKNALFSSQDNLRQFVLNTLVQGKYTASQLTPGTSLTTLQGDKIQITESNYEVLVNGAKFVLADVPATDGVIQVIDAVLIPSSINLSTPTGTLPLPSILLPQSSP